MSRTVLIGPSSLATPRRRHALPARPSISHPRVQVRDDELASVRLRWHKNSLVCRTPDFVELEQIAERQGNDVPSHAWPPRQRATSLWRRAMRGYSSIFDRPRPADRTSTLVQEIARVCVQIGLACRHP